MKTTRMLFTFFYFLFCTILFLPEAYSQSEKGSILLGGNATMSFSSQSHNKYFSASVSPHVGIFIANRFALGATIPFGYSSSWVNSSRYLNIGIGPFVRYYMGGGKVVPFLQGKGGWNHSRYSYEEPSGIKRKDIQNSGYGGLGLGLAYFITPSVGLESLLSYDLYRQNSFTNRVLNLNVGFQIYFSRNKE
jgi:hypothetical protein